MADQRLGIPYELEEMMPGTYPAGLEMQAQNSTACTSHNVTQTAERLPAEGTTGADVLGIHLSDFTTLPHPEPPSTHKLKDALRQVQGDAAQAPSTLGRALPPTESSMVSDEPPTQSTHKLKDALHQVQGESAQAPSALTKASSDVPLMESFENMKISGEPTTLPSVVQDEYYRAAMTHNIDDDPLNLTRKDAPFIGGSRMVFPAKGGEARDLGSDRSRGGYMPGDGSEPVDRGYGEGDVAVGHGGVTYYRSGRGGILPGYPTEEGMSKLIFDRIKDDQLRLAQVDNPTSVSMPVAAGMSRSTNSSEGYPTSLPSHSNKGGSGSSPVEGRQVPCLDFRIIEVKRESTFAEDDSSSAPGKFENPFTSGSSGDSQNRTSPAIPPAIPTSTSILSTSSILPAESTKNNVPIQSGDSRCAHSLDNRAVKEKIPVSEGDGQAGTFEAVFQPASSSGNWGSVHNDRKSRIKLDSTTGTSSPVAPVIGGVGYLGKPISKSEF